MKSEDIKELKELIEFLKENNIGEFDLERGELKIRIKFAQEGGADLAGLARLVGSQAAQPAAIAPAPGVVSAAHAAAATTHPAEAPPARRTMRLRCMW